ncbi:hypothetical protein CEXT_118521 [Caerostris extrusa]|uniref:Uncharacterized protein n=1 Tax=Caerostris extrusa TaxID=172846 RepID=A0AAV4YB37_CAEEX|nr:hypothetical protein CEXT_118521 [Caerostris extrusa]
MFPADMEVKIPDYFKELKTEEDKEKRKLLKIHCEIPRKGLSIQRRFYELQKKRILKEMKSHKENREEKELPKPKERIRYNNTEGNDGGIRRKNSRLFHQYHELYGDFPTFPTEEEGGSTTMFQKEVERKAEAARKAAESEADEKDKKGFDQKLLEMEVEDEVQLMVRLQVDENMRMECDRLSKALRKDSKKKKKGRKEKGREEKKGKKKSKKKKEVDLTPDRSLESLVSEINKQSEGVPENDPLPCLGDIRRVVNEYCVLPMGSEAIHAGEGFCKICASRWPSRFWQTNTSSCRLH